MDKKIKVLTISDHPFSPSGVGTQTKYFIEALLDTGKFSVVSLGGAMKHKSMQPIKTDKYGDDWVIFPVEGYGNQESLRAAIKSNRPDILWFMTDPRFYDWLWAMDHEVRSLVPMVYYHVWDNFPLPTYNKMWYESNDVIVPISKVTDEIVKGVTPDVQRQRIPHAVNPEFFHEITDPEKLKEVDKIRVSGFNNKLPKDKFTVFWNNRNAKRKLSGSLIYWFKAFLDEVGHDNAALIMHTDPFDEVGQNLPYILDDLGITNGEVFLSAEKLPPEKLAAFYTIADVTVNVSDAEGFGLATLESLACGTPIIVNKTGGLQEQVQNGDKMCGIGIDPASKAIIGSQSVPWIYEDRISQESFVSALKEFYEMDKEKRAELAKNGLEHVHDNYNFEDFKQSWIDLMLEVHEKYGSWSDRKNYQGWRCVKIENGEK